MTTPPPTADVVTSRPELPGAPNLPDWLPDESTLNRLAGEFFAALPGTAPTVAPSAVGPIGAGSPQAPTGGVEHAPRVDVPARSKEISQVPGDGGTAPAVGSDTGSLPGDVAFARPTALPVDAPIAGSGFSPGRAIPDLSEATSGLLGGAGLGPLLPEGPIVPGLTGLQLAHPGELTPAIDGSSAPRPDDPVPGVPAGDQLMGAGGLPNGPPDVTAGAPFAAGGFGPPAAAPEGFRPVPFSTAGGLSVPSAPGGETIPPLQGLSGPLPSAGVPGVPASDQVLSGAGAPSGPPDLTAGSGALTTAAGVSQPAPVADLHADPFAVPSGIAAPGSQPLAPAPFATPPGLATPAVPPVPEVPGVTGATGAPAVPATTGGGSTSGATPPPPAGVPDTATPVGTSPSSNDVSPPSVPVSSVPLPSVPQPPIGVPDAPVPVPTPSTPYYFVAETSPYRGAGESGLDTLVASALSPVQVEPPAVGPASGATGGRPAGEGGDQAQVMSAPAYYFAERGAPAAGGASARSSADPLAPDPHPPFDVNLVRRDFPILRERVNGKPLVWLDNAATTQKPQAVLDRLTHFYQHENSNIHRAAHELAARATDAYEGARKTVARFIGAGSEKDIIFVRGATEAINLVAKSWGRKNIHRGDEIIISHLEHHANIVPWQQLISETGAKLRVIPVDDSGQILLGEYAKLLCDKTKLVSVTQVSNALGTVTPIQQVVEMGHRAGACVLVDGAQSVPHLRVDLQTLGADFFVFSGHKIFGPTGIGVLYGRPEVLESMPPWEGGGNMIADVTFEKTVYQNPPNRFEAGTGNIADAVGLGAALDYVTRLGPETIARYEHSLLEYATPRMQAVRGLRMIGTATDKASVLSFVLDGYRTEEVGAALNQEGIAVRSGHHCAQPILRRFGVEATVRPSLAFYNTHDEIDLLVSVLHKLAANRGRH